MRADAADESSKNNFTRFNITSFTPKNQADIAAGKKAAKKKKKRTPGFGDDDDDDDDANIMLPDGTRKKTKEEIMAVKIHQLEQKDLEDEIQNLIQSRI